MNVESLRQNLTEMITELLELYIKEQEGSSKVPCAQTDSEDITDKIEVIKDIVNKQVSWKNDEENYGNHPNEKMANG